MTWRDGFAAAGSAGTFSASSKFEHGMILLLAALIAVISALAVRNLTPKVAASVVYANFDPTEYAAFQDQSCVADPMRSTRSDCRNSCR